MPVLVGTRRALAARPSLPPLASLLFGNGEDGFLAYPAALVNLYQDSAGTTPVTADSDPVGRFVDQSGRGNHALQATAANRPLWRENAGKPYLAFDGTNDGISTPLVPNATSGLTLAAAFKTTNISSIILGGGTTAGNKRATIGVNGVGTLTIGWGTAVSKTAAEDIRNTNVVVIVAGDFASRSIYVNGVDYTSLFAASSGAPDGTGGELTLGARRDAAGSGYDSFVNGNLNAALVLNRRVTPTEIARITADFQKTFF